MKNYTGDVPSDLTADHYFPLVFGQIRTFVLLREGTGVSSCGMWQKEAATSNIYMGVNIILSYLIF